MYSLEKSKMVNQMHSAWKIYPYISLASMKFDEWLEHLSIIWFCIHVSGAAFLTHTPIHTLLQ
jgi:hypothetical protein